MTTALVIFILFYTTAAFWRLPCPRQIGIARVDPLVAAGAISEHAHTIHGGNSKYIQIHVVVLATESEALIGTLRSLSRHLDFGVNATSDD